MNRFPIAQLLALIGIAGFALGSLWADPWTNDDPPAKKESQTKDAQTKEDPPAKPEPKLEEKLKARIAAFREKQKRAALAVAVITPQLEFFDGSGSVNYKAGSSKSDNNKAGSDKTSDAAPTATTPFEIGSITKVFTGILLSEAVERGELRLDDPLGKILPDWKFPEFDTRQITAVDLTTHTSGLPAVPIEVTGRAFFPWLDPYASYTVDKLKKDMSTITIARPPGATQSYSNLGAGTLGTILTLKAKKAHYNDLVKERILDPWGMKNTVPNTPKLAGRPAAYDSAGLVTKAWTFDALSGAGCLASTAEDMLLFSRKFFDPADKKAVLARVMRNWHELPTVELGKFQTKAIGFGAFQAKVKGRSETVYWHNGGTGGFSSFWAVVPERKIAIVVLCSASDRNVDKMGVDLLLEGLSAK